MSQAEETACAKAMKQDSAWRIGGTAKRSVWLEKRERGRRWGQGGDRGRLCTDLYLGSYLEGGGSPGGLWVEDGRDLTPCSLAPSGGYCGEDRPWGLGQELGSQA